MKPLAIDLFCGAEPLRLLDMFSGIGGFSLGFQNAGFARPVAFVEIDPFCQRVLAKHWPSVPCHDDVKTREFIEGEADVIAGGFPCQDVSCAGKRAGITGARSGLYRELVRAIRVVRPKVAVLENVAALLSDGMGTVLGDLAEGGACIEWDCVPACAIGAPHERERVFIVAHPDYERCGETRELRHRPDEVPAGRTEARSAPADVADVAGKQVGSAGQSWGRFGVEPSSSTTASYAELHGYDEATFRGGISESEEKGRVLEPKGRFAPSSYAARVGWGEGRPRRPPDSFARIRDEARRNVADPYGARVRFAGNPDGASLWPDEPALSGVDDVVPNWVDRTKATGNAILPVIAELIGRALAAGLSQKEAAE